MLTRNVVRYAKRRASTGVQTTAAPKYPPILDLSEGAVKIRNREQYRDKINSLEAVEEKLFFPNLQHYYGTRCLSFQEGKFPFNFLPFVKYITRTQSLEVDDKTFQQFMSFNPNEAKELVERIRPYLQEALLFEILDRNQQNSAISNEREVSSKVIERINDVLLSSLSMQYQHLFDCTVDYNPRVEAYWLAGDFHPSPEVHEQRTEKIKEMEKDNKKKTFPDKIDIDPAETVEHFVQYVARPLVQLRGPLSLPPLDTSLVKEDGSSEEFSRVSPSPSLEFGVEEIRRHGTNIAGFWPGDACEHGLLSYHHMDTGCGKDHLNTQAILNGFSWLYAQAMYQGFSTYSELTYPLTSQQIITNGCQFSFNLYQLNTSILHKLLPTPNVRKNLCVSLHNQQLYQGIENNKFVGWNDSVLLNLLAFYLNKPADREVETKPHLNETKQFLSQIEEEEKRNWLHNQFRHMFSNRPRHFLPYEIYDWERIYKIKFKTRAMEARKRPFELDQDPLEERKYWDSMSAYIPRKFRPRKRTWNGWKAKFTKTYFPEP